MKMSKIMDQFLRFAILGAFVYTMFAGCEHMELTQPPISPGPTDVDTLARFSAIQRNIFTPKCAVPGCHLGATAPFGLDLSEGEAFGNLVNIPSQEVPTLNRVEPGQPDSSYLVLKIEGAPGIVGARMPLGRDPLTQGEIDAIRKWIRGAANN